MKRKPKFVLGQVVAWRDGHRVRPVWFGKVRYVGNGGLYNIDGYVAYERELRPLTARERGPRKAAGKGGK